MFDLYLDPNTHDLVVDDFSIKVITTKQDWIIQKLKIKLLWFKGEWFLDETYGMPYYQEIFVGGLNLESVNDIFKLAISTESGVEKLISYSSVYDRTTRRFSITAKIKVDSGEIISLAFTL